MGLGVCEPLGVGIIQAIAGRREALLALYRARGNNADADADSLLMPFLGKRVCRRNRVVFALEGAI